MENNNRPNRSNKDRFDGGQRRKSFNPNFDKQNRSYNRGDSYKKSNYDNNKRREGEEFQRYREGERRQRFVGERNNSRSFGEERRGNNFGNERRKNNFGGERPSRYDSTERRQNRFEGRKSFSSDRPSKNFERPHYEKPRPVKYSKDFIDLNQPMRLNKFLANSNICSRREADEFIASGVVSVNGQIVTELGTKIIPATDKVFFHNDPVSMDKKIYILLNKPKNVITSSDDPKERKTVLDLIQGACNERVYPVGRLDRNTTGVLLITNDGDLTAKLTHPKYLRKKIYHVRLDRDFTEQDMEAMRQGIVLEDGEIKADDISYVKEDSLRQVGIEIHSGRNRIVRRMFEHLGYKIADLDRVYFAGLTKKNVPRGRWRFLSETEVNFLKMNPQ